MTGTFGEADHTYGDTTGTFGALEELSTGQGFGDCTFGSGTFGEPCPEPPTPGIDLINIIETDGRIFQLPIEQPYSFIADTGQIPIGRRAATRTPMIGQTGVHVRIRFIQAEERLPTYTGLQATHTDYLNVIADYPTYHDIITDPDLGTDIDYDITCFVAGINITRGRQGLFDDIDAGTCSITLIDQLGLFDPRWEDTLLGPGRRIRTGTWLTVELYRQPNGHRCGPASPTPGPATSPPKRHDRRNHRHRLLTGLATAHVTGPVAQQRTGERIQDLLINYWQSTWGNWTIPAGTTPLYAETIEDDTALDLIRAAAQVDDGRIYIDAAGNFRYETGDWRDNRTNKAVILGRGATDFLEGTISICTYDRIKFGSASYTDLLDDFLVYDDMTICVGDGTMPIVCGGYFTSADIADDVTNEIVIEYQPAGDSTDTVRYSATDSESIARYGKRGFARSDLTPVDGGVLQTLADTLLDRWKTGDATVTEIGVDLLREGLGTNVLIGLQSGDRLVTVDEIPSEVGAPERWAVSTSEVMSIQWNLGPTQFTLAITLDQLRASRPTTEPEEEGAFLHDINNTDRTAATTGPAHPAAALNSA